MFKKAEIEIIKLNIVDIIVTSDIGITGPPDWKEWMFENEEEQ